MNLLLLLSALLSALTGVAGGSRQAQAMQVVAAEASPSVVVAAKATRSVSRSPAPLPTLFAVAWQPPGFVAATLVTRSLLLITGRRRE